MSSPHKCPVCNGTGRVIQYPTQGSSTSIQAEVYKACSACNGSGIVWEPDKTNAPFIPSLPQPDLIRPPTFTPNDPVVGPTFPPDYDFPKEIREKSKKDVVGILKDWIKELENPEEAKKKDKREVLNEIPQKKRNKRTQSGDI